jgi:alpha-L-fucosidase 2
MIACTLAASYVSGGLALSAPIERWDEAVPLGNGMMGALVYGGGSEVRIALDRGDLWDLRRVPVVHEPGFTYANMRRLVESGDKAEFDRLFDSPYNSPYPTKLPGGALTVGLPEGARLRLFRLDFATGEAVAAWNGGSLRAFFDSQSDVLHLRSDGAVGEVRLHAPAGLGRLGYPAPTAGSRDGVDWVECPRAGAQAYVLAAATRRDERGVSVAATVAVGSPDEVGRSVRRALEEGHEAPAARSRAWWRAHNSSSSVRVPDERLQRHYELCKYLYGAASRAGAPPMPLQGVWTADEGGLPPWKGDFHNDLNTQTTYLAYPVAGLFDSGLSWTEFNWRLMPTYRRFAREFYGVTGAVVPGVMSLDGEALGGWGMYSLSPTNGAWIAHQFYRHWKLSGDGAFLRLRAYPFCSEVGTALLGILTEKEGRLAMPLSSSPEIHDNTFRAFLRPNSNYDGALLAWLFQANAEMAGELGKDPSRWEEAAARIAPLATDPEDGGLAFAEGENYRSSHRHFSHALAVHPLGTLHVESGPQERATIAATVSRLERHGTDWWTGYSFSWFACLLARTGDGDRALRYLRDYERAFTSRNGFHLNGDQTGEGLSQFTYRPFTLEGNFLAMEAVHEMLIQSWGGVVRVFPSVPSAWQDAEFRELRAEGGHKVSARRAGGRTVEVRVALGPKGRVVVRDPFDGEGQWTGASPVPSDRGLEFRGRPGSVVVGRSG